MNQINQNCIWRSVSELMKANSAYTPHNSGNFVVVNYDSMQTRRKKPREWPTCEWPTYKLTSVTECHVRHKLEQIWIHIQNVVHNFNWQIIHHSDQMSVYYIGEQRCMVDWLELSNRRALHTAENFPSWAQHKEPSSIKQCSRC